MSTPLAMPANCPASASWSSIAGDAPTARSTFALNCCTTVFVMHWMSGCPARSRALAERRSKSTMTIPSLVWPRSGSMGVLSASVISASALQAGRVVMRHAMSLTSTVSAARERGESAAGLREGPRISRAGHGAGGRGGSAPPIASSRPFGVDRTPGSRSPRRQRVRSAKPPLPSADVPLAAAAERIDDDGGEQNERGDDLLRIGVEADEVETVVDRADDQGAEHRGPGRTAPAEQGGAADDGRRDRVEQVLGADQ